MKVGSAGHNSRNSDAEKLDQGMEIQYRGDYAGRLVWVIAGWPQIQTLPLTAQHQRSYSSDEGGLMCKYRERTSWK